MTKKNGKVFVSSVVLVLAAITAASATAYAQPQRKLVVLIDASGSMVAPSNGGTRFDSAKAFAKSRVDFYAAQEDPLNRPLKVAVYTFRGLFPTFDDAPVLHTDGAVNSGFVDVNFAHDAIDCLIPDPASLLPLTDCSQTPDHGAPFQVGGATPLAHATCQIADVLSNPAFAADLKLLQLSSDGEENSSLSGPCQGPTGIFNSSTNAYDPSDAWQNKIINYFTGKGISTHTDLFMIRNLPLRAAAEPDPEGILAPDARRFGATPSATTGLTPLEQFFTLLAQATGGQLTVIHDDEPLPVIGDSDGDGCVGRADAILVARSFGPIAPPKDGRFDLNFDRSVDFTDYVIERSRMTPGCGPDPYIARPPVACTGPKQIVIDGAVIESGGTTIDVRSACQIVIRNSLIVSGLNSITIDGSAVVKVDNSIIVGQNALIGTRGTIILSAANSIFHGLLRTNGALNYINRGGNIFE
jgi:hypothetical protein